MTLEEAMDYLAEHFRFWRLEYDPAGGRAKPWEVSVLDGGGLAQRYRANYALGALLMAVERTI